MGISIDGHAIFIKYIRGLHKNIWKKLKLSNVESISEAVVKDMRIEDENFLNKKDVKKQEKTVLNMTEVEEQSKLKQLDSKLRPAVRNL